MTVLHDPHILIYLWIHLSIISDEVPDSEYDLSSLMLGMVPAKQEHTQKTTFRLMDSKALAIQDQVSHNL